MSTNSTEVTRALLFYKKNESNNEIFNCLICKKDKNGKKRSNLVSHLKLMHVDKYNENVKRPDKGSLTAFRVKRLKLLQSCVRMVTIDQEPFALLRKTGFSGIIANKLRKFAEAGIPLNLSDPNLTVVKDYIHKAAEGIRIKIKNEIKGRFFSLMADGVTKRNRSFLGIGVQYVMNGSLKIRSLGLEKLDEAHTGKYLSDIIKNCVQEFGCDMHQMIGATTDNASNMSKMVRELNSNACEEDGPENSVEMDSNCETNQHLEVEMDIVLDNQNIKDAQIVELLQRIATLECEELALLLNDSDDDESELDLPQINMQFATTRPIFVNQVNCASHTLQLVVKDALDALPQEHKNVIKLCREFAKFIRRQSSLNKLVKHGIKVKLPRFDCITRWSSTYMMLKGILDCLRIIEFFASENEEICELLLSKIHIVKEIVNILEIFFEATIESQKSNLTLSGFYKCWIITQLKLDSRLNQPSHTNLTSHLLKSMKKREPKLLDNDLMKCSLILDPRFCDELDKADSDKAKEMLVKVWSQMKEFKNQVNDAGTMAENASSSSNADIFVQYMKNKSKKRLQILEDTFTDDDVISSINTFIQHETVQGNDIQSDWTILNFWENKKNTYSVLYELAMVIFSIAPSQATIERNFSVLSLIFELHRCNLGTKMLQDILMIVLNSDLFEEVNSEEIENLMSQTEAS